MNAHSRLKDGGSNVPDLQYCDHWDGKNEGMPELPEVETARRLIADEALHRRIADVDDSDTFVRPPLPVSCAPR